MTIAYIVSVPRDEKKPKGRHSYINKAGLITANIDEAEEHVDLFGAETAAKGWPNADVVRVEAKPRPLVWR